MDHRLAVYIASRCYGCDEACALAGIIADRFPGLQVDVVDVDNPESERPSAVFAVPTYLLDSELLWLGNPRRDDALQKIADFLQENQHE